MSTDFTAIAAALMSSGNKDLIAGKQEKLQKLADSGDGKKVGAMLEGNVAFQRALEKGDTDALKKQISALLATEEGARLARQLSGIFK